MRSEREKNSLHIYKDGQEKNSSGCDSGDWSEDISPPAESETVEIPGHPSAVCQTCRCPMFWEDPFGRLHCCNCLKPPATSMVRRTVLVIHLPAGQAWEEVPNAMWLDRLKRAEFSSSPGRRMARAATAGIASAF